MKFSNKRFIVLVISMLALLYVSWNLPYFKYAYDTQDFQTITLAEVKEKLDSEKPFYLYVGRKTCPYCRVFVPKLKVAAYHEKVTIFYLDSESSSLDSNFHDFREQYDINKVPTVLFFHHHLNQKFSGNSKSTVTDIEEFMNSRKDEL